jgi:hypothetical protein
MNALQKIGAMLGEASNEAWDWVKATGLFLGVVTPLVAAFFGVSFLCGYFTVNWLHIDVVKALPNAHGKFDAIFAVGAMELTALLLTALIVMGILSGIGKFIKKWQSYN